MSKRIRNTQRELVDQLNKLHERLDKFDKDVTELQTDVDKFYKPTRLAEIPNVLDMDIKTQDELWKRGWW